MLKRAAQVITNNIGLKLLAILFAIVLWLVVVNIDDPKTTRSFTATVGVENESYLTGMGKCYDIMNNSNVVTFKVSGKRSYLERMSNSDFKAVADMESIENFKRVPIEIIPQRYTGNVSVIGKSYYLDVTVEDLVVVPFMISISVDGKVAENNALGEIKASPTLLRVTGPRSVVEKIDKAVAVVNVDGMSADMTDSVIPVLYDADGKVIDASDLKFNAQSVLVSAKILDTKEVTLNFQTSGTLPDKYEYTGTQYEPETVRIKGESHILNTINSITIPKEVLDLTDATGDIEKEIDISSYLPEGASLAEPKKSKIKVTVKIEKHETRTFKVPTANITASNLGAKYDVEFLEDNVEVEIEGLTSELDALKEDTLTGSIDVNGMTKGEHTLNLVLNLDSKYTMKKPAAVTVDIVQAKEPTAENDSNTSDSAKKENEKNDVKQEDKNNNTKNTEETDTESTEAESKNETADTEMPTEE